MRKETVYFDKAGLANTDECVAAAVARAQELGLRYLVVASTSGDTAEKLQAAVGERDMKVVCVTYHAGFHGGDDTLPIARREKLRALGIEVVICSHALSGVERSIKDKFGTIGPLELMAHTLRCFGQGVKVAVEIAVMAADSAAVPTDQDIVCLGGSGKGCDAALVVRAAHQNTFFDLRVREIVAMVR